MEKIFVQRPQAEVSFLKKWIEKNGRDFRVLPGLFQELQEREADQEILVENENGEVTISEKIVFTIDREGMLQLA